MADRSKSRSSGTGGKSNKGNTSQSYQKAQPAAKAKSATGTQSNVKTSTGKNEATKHKHAENKGHNQSTTKPKRSTETQSNTMTSVLELEKAKRIQAELKVKMMKQTMENQKLQQQVTEKDQYISTINTLVKAITPGSSEKRGNNQQNFKPHHKENVQAGFKEKQDNKGYQKNQKFNKACGSTCEMKNNFVRTNDPNKSGENKPTHNNYNVSKRNYFPNNQGIKQYGGGDFINQSKFAADKNVNIKTTSKFVHNNSNFIKKTNITGNLNDENKKYTKFVPNKKDFTKKFNTADRTYVKHKDNSKPNICDLMQMNLLDSFNCSLVAPKSTSDDVKKTRFDSKMNNQQRGNAFRNKFKKFDNQKPAHEKEMGASAELVHSSVRPKFNQTPRFGNNFRSARNNPRSNQPRYISPRQPKVHVSLQINQPMHFNPQQLIQPPEVNLTPPFHQPLQLNQPFPTNQPPPHYISQHAPLGQFPNSNTIAPMANMGQYVPHENNFNRFPHQQFRNFHGRGGYNRRRGNFRKNVPHDKNISDDNETKSEPKSDQKEKESSELTVIEPDDADNDSHIEPDDDDANDSENIESDNTESEVDDESEDEIYTELESSADEEMQNNFYQTRRENINTSKNMQKTLFKKKLNRPKRNIVINEDSDEDSDDDNEENEDGEDNKYESMMKGMLEKLSNALQNTNLQATSSQKSETVEEKIDNVASVELAANQKTDITELPKEENAQSQNKKDNSLNLFFGSNFPTEEEAKANNIDLNLEVKDMLMVAKHQDKIVREQPRTLQDMINFKKLYPNATTVVIKDD